MNTFVCADLHLGHKGIVNFLREDGVTKERPFDTVEEMNETIIHNWNAVVGVKDMVFVLGDAVINRSALPLLGRLQGRKQLVMGNHDSFRTAEYLQYFENVRGSWAIDNFLMTHIPVHESELGSRWKGNLHGHLHSKRVSKGVKITCSRENGIVKTEVIDHRYLCVSLEHTNYKPILWEEVMKRFQEQQ